MSSWTVLRLTAALLLTCPGSPENLLSNKEYHYSTETCIKSLSNLTQSGPEDDCPVLQCQFSSNITIRPSLDSPDREERYVFQMRLESE